MASAVYRSTLRHRAAIGRVGHDRHPAPAALPRLLEPWEGQEQGQVIYDPDRVRELRNALLEDTVRAALQRENITAFAGNGRRSVTRHSIRNLADATD